MGEWLPILVATGLSFCAASVVAEWLVGLLITHGRMSDELASHWLAPGIERGRFPELTLFGVQVRYLLAEQ
jgi:hypothetical protein